MTKNSRCRRIAIACNFGIALSLFSQLSPIAHAAEPTFASGHICSGCASCDPPTSTLSRAHEQSCVDPFHRSGHPETQSKLAKPSLNKHYTFGYVGGGTAFHGEPRFSDEGTWGVDYSGVLLKKRTWLQWLHGSREQRHDGSYHTDGTHLLSH